MARSGGEGVNPLTSQCSDSELYLAEPDLRAARDRNSANTSAKTIPVFTPISFSNTLI